MTAELLEEVMENQAVVLGAILNGVADDDERERLEQIFERRLNAELFHGAEVRAADERDAQVARLHRVLRRSTPVISKRMRVRHDDGREGVVLGFHRRREWSFARPTLMVFAVVLLDNGDRPLWPLASLTPVLEGAKA